MIPGQYDLVGTGFTKVHKTTTAASNELCLLASGAYGPNSTLTDGQLLHATGTDAIENGPISKGSPYARKSNSSVMPGSSGRS